MKKMWSLSCRTHPITIYKKNVSEKVFEFLTLKLLKLINFKELNQISEFHDTTLKFSLLSSQKNLIIKVKKTYFL